MQSPLAQAIAESPVIITPTASSISAAPLKKSLFASLPSLHLPQAAKLTTVYAALFIAPIAGALGINHTSVLHASSLNSPIAATPQHYEPAIQASAQNTLASSSSSDQGFEYEVALANGFLKKAVDLSNASPTQTVEEKSMIVQLLTQALDAANRAIELSPNAPNGYTSRGRIYQATSAVKPEMKALADQDFAKASALGSSNPTQAPTTKNPAELLPTEQAQGKTTAMIAGPETKQKETVQGKTEQNAKRGTITLSTGKTEIVVPYTAVKDTTQLYVTAENNPENLTFYVKNKEAGAGFTIASTAAPTAPVDITWWEIE